MRVVTICTQHGWLAAGWSEAGLRGLVLPQKSYEEAIAKLAVQLRVDSSMLLPEQPQDVEKKLVQEIEKYFRGELVNFTASIDWTGYTSFQRQVLAVVQQIPYGKVSSYKQVAIEAGFSKAARAVGGVMRSNRTPLVIPCHRVLASDGSLGGFSGGLDAKKLLLELESIPAV
ncbi:methylated-DNA--[protein]-cysteine S-methyltransferase [Pelotomaculum terephthalicicum JT]|uniref:methylated-DNA--[protein]-cysteine S-methyltransferase n=1 Tax=Pelotomaculum TaxID=191373 RepID=UPI0009C6FA9C|nr:MULTISPECIES: methylated-DNA--[protein]-cysteine S-methyltransferase [Pelotomaculum]MCG9967657.1 methylated-DNA--[protein]-cysteine S-methyltransferase [Pelotomaculum terephthalicicum JT]OPX84047.1 MAG: Methylated-DNA--protein-cysteine methyltransferase [Pelotomaculum sp. PtaB.Bin117]OPY59408.1 MAG: Methylated-DNA--protein-cysteine methyltransferase [Pelotomaculum sp. PtaU1.Bin065]